MTTQPEALRLAELWEKHSHGYALTPEAMTAAELRRQHAEIERLHQINQSHEMKLSVRGYEIQIADLEAQRDALLEALHAIVRRVNGAASYRMGSDIDALARAAIKMAEEGK